MYKLYQSPISYYSGKVRAYLRYKCLSFEQITSSDKVANEVIKPATGGWRVIPILEKPDGNFIQDSSIILDELEMLHSEYGITPDGIKQKFVSSLFELYGDEWLVIPAMHYRWSFKKENLSHILNGFGQTRKPHWPTSIRWMAGILPAMLFGNVAGPILGVSKKNIPALESWTEDILSLLDTHFAEHDYLLGSRACYGDFGLFGPIYAHLYLDPYPYQNLIAKRPHLKAWIERMNQEPESLNEKENPQSGEWLSNDEIPETLLPILEWQLKDQLPVLQEISRSVDQWCKKNPDAQKLPRFLGRQNFQLNGVSGKRMRVTYSQWMLERALAHYEMASDGEKKSLEDWLEKHEMKQWLEVNIQQPLQFHNSRLWRKDKLARLS
jgi:glutathione S-transferase